MNYPTFACGAGSFSGYTEENCIQITGIRYAQSKRFEAPTPYTYPEGVHACRSEAPYAVQLPSAAEGNFSGMDYENRTQEESCQYLSITIPENVEQEEKLPVMVWIHGGAYRNGGCDGISYDRTRLVRENRVIVVGVNYRLGILGFTRDLDGNFANLGLLDLMEGLRWIQNNITAFCGDRTNVTIFGQSAGADAVRCLMLADDVDGLFQRCIMQSDPIGTLDGREEMERKILEEVMAMSVDADLDEVRNVQASVTEHVTEQGMAKYMIFGPHEGVYPLPARSEMEERMKHAASKYDLLIGSNTREVSAYLVSKKMLWTLDRLPIIGGMLENIIRNLSQQIFIGPTEEFAAKYASFGGNAYLYSFYWGAKKSFVGACHMMEYLPLFGSDKLKKDMAKMGKTDKQIHEEGIPMRKIWADFARTGCITETSVKDMLEVEKMV